MSKHYVPLVDAARTEIGFQELGNGFCLTYLMPPAPTMSRKPISGPLSLCPAWNQL
jgi:hypothetical protein